MESGVHVLKQCGTCADQFGKSVEEFSLVQGSHQGVI